MNNAQLWSRWVFFSNLQSQNQWNLLCFLLQPFEVVGQCWSHSACSGLKWTLKQIHSKQWVLPLSHCCLCVPSQHPLPWPWKCQCGLTVGEDSVQCPRAWLVGFVLPRKLKVAISSLLPFFFFFFCLESIWTTAIFAQSRESRIQYICEGLLWNTGIYCCQIAKEDIIILRRLLIQKPLSFLQ